ncbi:hypothetical protein [Aestuariivirga sp.]|uniref:hypothetical protein n=1 Tax=Aestuariivirga sp. TaxID=2650926 RepID=UPI0039E55039
MKATPSLQDAINAVYSAFSDVRRPVTMDASPVKNRALIDKILMPMSLKKLTGDDLGYYFASAMTTIGDSRDFRYFLPRILDIATQEAGENGFQPWLIVHKLIYANWDLWPAEKRAAILDVFSSAFMSAAHRDPHEVPEAHEWLTGLMLLEENPEPYLAVWRRGDPMPSLLQFAATVNWYCPSPGDREGIGDFSEAIQHRILDWLNNPATRALLEEGSSRASEADEWNFQLALSKLDGLQAEDR